MEFTNSTDINNSFSDFISIFSLKTRHSNVMRLNVYIANDPELKGKYIEHAQKHNNKIVGEPHFYDSGFDVLLSEANKTFCSDGVNKVDFQIRCCAQVFSCDNINDNFYTGFYIYPRSSLSKTPLRLANCTGIIDAGYRGPIIGMFDCLRETFSPALYDRLIQICAPNLMPIFVNVVDSLADLGPNTSRGEGGFGST
jgi:dUTP pyrophosphatase